MMPSDLDWPGAVYFERQCPFCLRIEARDYLERYNGVVRFEPLNPVTPGHMLFVPTQHVLHPYQGATGAAMGCAEAYAGRVGLSYNLITSSGLAATQTVAHIHVHYVPRRADDGLHLPWTVTYTEDPSALAKIKGRPSSVISNG